MLKSSILNVKVYNTFFKAFLRSYWYVLFLGPPVFLFLALSYFNAEVAGLLMKWSPPSIGQGAVFYSDLVELIATEALWICFFFFLATALTMYVPHSALGKFGDLGKSVHNGSFITVVGLLLFGAAVMTALVTLESFPNSSDEYSYLFQAEIFSRDKLWERSHILPDFFYFNNIVQQDGIIVSRYPPGWPLMLSIAHGLHISPALINPVLAVMVLVVFYSLARRSCNDSVAFWALLAVATTAYFIFQAASYFPHMWTLLLTVLFVGNLYLYYEKERLIFILLAGFSLGLLLVSLPYTAFWVLLPFLICLSYRYGRRAFYLFTAMAMGTLPCVAYFLWYNYSITGDPFNPVSLWANPSQHPGFFKGHDFVAGLEHLSRWIFVFFYWVSPGLLILYLIMLWRKLRSASDRFHYPEDYICLSLAVGYFFYLETGGNQYGARFLFEGFPFLVLFVVRQVMRARKAWMFAFLFASVLIAAVKLPFISEREALIVDQRQDMFDIVKERDITHAVVFVASGTSPIRPMPPDDLTRNDIRFQNEVIYVLDLPGIRHQLMDFYGDRNFYRYMRFNDEISGELQKLE